MSRKTILDRQKYKVAIIICYLGKIPDYFSCFLITCGNNPDYHWIIITDNENDYDVPENVSIVYMTIDDIRSRIHKQVGDWAELKNPYKLCDYKPAFGLIFHDLLIEYSHWGYGDMDVVYGQLNHFISQKMLETYDKIFPLGHFSIMRNNEECRKAFMMPAEGTYDYRDVYSNASSFYFDEYKGINEKMMANGLKVYCNIDFLDASAGGYSRIHLVDNRMFKLVFSGSEFVHYKFPPNYKKQCFIIKNKKLFHVFSSQKCISQEEYAYLHFRRRLLVELNGSGCDMIIGHERIDELKIDITEEVIEKYNKMEKSDNIVFFDLLVKGY